MAAETSAEERRRWSRALANLRPDVTTALLPEATFNNFLAQLANSGILSLSDAQDFRRSNYMHGSATTVQSLLHNLEQRDNWWIPFLNACKELNLDIGARLKEEGERLRQTNEHKQEPPPLELARQNGAAVDPDTIYILAIDGGGMRGILPLRILECLTQLTGKQPNELFDVICGTSTGGIIAILVGILKVPIRSSDPAVEDCMTYYPKLGAELFTKTNSNKLRRLGASIKQAFQGASGVQTEKHNTEKLETMMREKIEKILGNGDTKMQDEASKADKTQKRPHVFVVACEGTEHYLFRNYVDQYTPANPEIWKAARATSAAPSYFLPIDIEMSPGIVRRFVDGGVGHNNPAGLVVPEMQRISPGRKLVIVSLGTGISSLQTNQDLAKTIKLLKKIATECEATHEQVKANAEGAGNTYVRLNAGHGLGNVGMDRVDLVGKMDQIAQKYIDQNREELSKLAKLLADGRGWSLPGAPLGAGIPRSIAPPTVQNFIHRLRQKLAADYKSYSTISLFQSVKPVPIDSLFVSVQFTKSRGEESTIDDYQKALLEFFEYGGAKREKKMMVITAQPGQGKTTLVKKICYDWSRSVDGIIDDSNAYISHVQLLLVRALRDVRTNVKSVLEMCASQLQDDLAEVQTWLESNASSFLVLLDGFDELRVECEQLNAIFFSDRILASMPPFPLIVTSRPTALRNAKLFFPAELRGLLASQIPRFIENYCSEKTERERVMRFLDKNRALKERLFRSPLLLSMLCALAEKDAISWDEEDKEFPRTQTALYLVVCKWMCEEERRRYTDTQLVQVSVHDAVFLPLAHLAFDTSFGASLQLVFDEDKLKKFNVDVDRATRIGFLVADGAASRRQLRLRFPHQTFQEFFGALFAVANPSQFREIFDQRRQCTGVFSDQFLVFVAGLLVGRSEAFDVLNRCLHEELEMIDDDYHDRDSIELEEQEPHPGDEGWNYDILTSLFVQIHNEVSSVQIRDSIFAPVFSDESGNREFLIDLLCALFFEGDSNFRFPRGCEGLFGSLCLSKHSYRVGVVSKPVSIVFISQTDELPRRQLSVDVLPNELNRFYFRGEARAFFLLLRSIPTLRVDRLCKLTLTAGAKPLGFAESDVQEQASVSGRVEILTGGRTEIVVEGALDEAERKDICNAILTERKINWLSLNRRL